jgi:hypothetical protein
MLDALGRADEREVGGGMAVSIAEEAFSLRLRGSRVFTRPGQMRKPRNEHFLTNLD